MHHHAGISGMPMAWGDAGLMPGTHQSHSVPAPSSCTGKTQLNQGFLGCDKTGRDPSANIGTGKTGPVWAHGVNLLPTKSQQDKDKGKKSLQNLPPTQWGSPRMRITRALSNGVHWGSSNANPPMGDGAGAKPKALPTLWELAGLPLLVAPLVSGQVRAL